ncbi:MAG: hypothetical protein CME70_08705 [Halobacteriovorax sp.]|nr:hypothetical protein [Halobacteriovorax sp.]|tara:strand:- start:97716 stop:98237 length:522 start_codon:yes stop_codon:yes gene_type:complete
MKSKIKIEAKNDLENNDESYYSTSDQSLSVSIVYPKEIPGSLSCKIEEKFELKKPYFLLNIDNLTITFEGEDLYLVSIDAYTNLINWESGTISVPEEKTFGYATLQKSVDDDRESITLNPRFLYDQRHSVLKIELSSTRTDKEEFFKISSNISIGLSNKTITSVFIEKLKIKP